MRPVTLGVDDLIEVVGQPSGEPDIRLRNLEYDLTRAIKKVVYGFQGLDTVFASLEEPVSLTAFVTPSTLPAGLESVPGTVEKMARELEAESGGKFTFEMIDPDAKNAAVDRATLQNYLHLVLQVGDDAILLYPSADMTEADIRTEIESALKRAAPGFLKTVGLWLPRLQPVQDPYTGQMLPPISSWNMLRQQLSQDYTVKAVDLTTGRVPGDIDVLVVIAPQAMSDEERFAIDQYLMRGGALLG